MHELRLKLHIIFEEKIPGALKEVWRIVHCHSLSVLKLEVWLPSGSTQQSQSLDIVGTHVTFDGNNMQASILACAKNLFKRSALVLPRMK